MRLAFILDSITHFQTNKRLQDLEVLVTRSLIFSSFTLCLTSYETSSIRLDALVGPLLLLVYLSPPTFNPLSVANGKQSIASLVCLKHRLLSAIIPTFFRTHSQNRMSKNMDVTDERISKKKKKKKKLQRKKKRREEKPAAMAEGVKGGERRSSNKEAASFLNSHLSRVLAAVRHASDSDTVSASACASASKSRSNGAKGRTRAAKSGGHVTARLKSCFTSEQVEDALECWSSEVKSLLDAGESENSLHLVACGSILIATEQEEIRKVIAALSTRTAATTLVIALLERVMEGSEEGPEAAQVNHLVMQATLLELLLAMRVHNQKDNCETLRALIQKQYWYHIHKSFFSLQSTSRDRGDQCTRLLSRSWALLPQLEENLVGTSKTRGVRGKFVIHRRQPTLPFFAQEYFEKKERMKLTDSFYFFPFIFFWC